MNGDPPPFVRVLNTIRLSPMMPGAHERRGRRHGIPARPRHAQRGHPAGEPRQAARPRPERRLRAAARLSRHAAARRRDASHAQGRRRPRGAGRAGAARAGHLRWLLRRAHRGGARARGAGAAAAGGGDGGQDGRRHARGGHRDAAGAKSATRLGEALLPRPPPLQGSFPGARHQWTIRLWPILLPFFLRSSVLLPFFRSSSFSSSSSFLSSKRLARALRVVRCCRCGRRPWRRS